MKPPRKERLSQRTENPPSRAWLIHQNDLKMWKDLNGLQGTSSGSAEVDARLRRKFGGYSNDPTARTNFRTKDGSPVQADNEDEGCVAQLPETTPPTEPFDALKYATELPPWA